ncbi:MAG: hypothetical protein LBB40_01480 [Holophagales bacterium]|jgi:hypothetical protein|nr:hypothetical protein [Holophagales bacterium]
MNREQESEENISEDASNEIYDENGDIQVKQDGYRHVYFGQIADGLIPYRPGPSLSTDDELSRAALSDPAASDVEKQKPQPTAWRIVFLIAIISVALAVVFWKK